MTTIFVTAWHCGTHSLVVSGHFKEQETDFEASPKSAFTKRRVLDPNPDLLRTKPISDAGHVFRLTHTDMKVYGDKVETLNAAVATAGIRLCILLLCAN